MLEEFQMGSLMSRPDLPHIAESINQTLREEQIRREKFREDLSPSMKAEFIAGEIVMHSPARAKHLRVVDKLVRLVSSYVQAKDLGEVFTEKALVCLTRNDYEPDICFFGTDKAEKFNDDTMKFPAPDFIVEVLSESTAHRDRGIKWDDYGMHRISEYWIIDADEKTVEQYMIRQGEKEYRLARKLTDGEIESSVIYGFRIPVNAIFDAKQNHIALKRILQSE